MVLVRTVRVDVSANFGDSMARLDEFNRRVDELSRATPSVRVQFDDTEARLKMDAFREDLRRLNRDSSGGFGGRGGLVGDLTGGAGAGGAGGAGAGGSLLLNPYTIGAATVLSPPVVGAGLGLTGFAALAIPTLSKITTWLTASGKAAAKAWAQMDPGQRAIGRSIMGLKQDFDALARSFEPVLKKDLQPLINLGKDLLPSLKPLAVAGGQVLDAFIKPLDSLVKSPFFGKFISVMSQVGVQFAKTFSPTLWSIVKSIMGLLKDLAPVSLQLWKALDPLVALIVKDFVKILDQTLPPLLKILPPLFKAWQPLIPPLTKLALEILPPLAKIFEKIAIDVLPAVTANINKIFVPALQYLIRWIKPVSDAVSNFAKNWGHDWGLVKDAVMTIVGNIITFLEGIPGKIKNALSSLGDLLLSLGKNAMNDMWSGIKTGAKNILGWFGGFISSITGFFKKILGISSPSRVFYDIGKNMMLGLEAGIKAHAHTAANAAKHVAQNLGGGGAPGVPHAVSYYAPQISQALRMLGQPAVDIGVVERQMETESGGNPTIVNKWDSNWAAGTPSVGLMQVIGPTFDAYAGPYRNVGPFEYGVSVNPMANIFAGLNYAVHRYGAAWTRVLGQGHGYANGLVNGLFTQPTLIGVGERGPEVVNVTPVGHGHRSGANSYTIVNNIHGPVTGGQMAEIGRVTVTAIKEFEKRSGSSWRRT